MSEQTTRLTAARYLELLAAEGTRLADASGDRSRAVPTCPGWDVADVVRHTGSVFDHKVACIRLGRAPRGPEWSHGPDAGQDLLDWYRGRLDALLGVLGALAPGDPAFTWYPPDQTVGFWQRRLAHETAVHRVDVESASGAVRPVEHDLATDGVDEVLDVFLDYRVGADPAEDVSGLAGRTVLVRTGGHAWLVSGSPGNPTGPIQLRRGVGRADAVVAGEPSELLLWLWGRRPDLAVTLEGDRSVAAALREVLARATT